MVKSDVLIIRDDVLFKKKEYHSRNKIRINSNDNVNNPQFKWIGVSVINDYGVLKDIEIDSNGIRGKRHWKDELKYQLLANYSSTKYFNEHFTNIMDIIDNSDKSLSRLNTDLIKYLVKSFGINTKIILASELNLTHTGNPTQDLINICNAVKGTAYLSGDGGRNYLDLDLFKNSNVELKFQNYVHPVYTQNHEGFLKYMSSLDALFCVGKYPDILNFEENNQPNQVGIEIKSEKGKRFKVDEILYNK